MMLKDLLKRALPPTTQMVDRRVELLSEQNRALEGGLARLQDELAALSEEARQTRRALEALRAQGARTELARRAALPLEGAPAVVLSLASYGARIKTLADTLRSLDAQTVRPDRLLLWLPASDFPAREADLPDDVVCAIADARAELRWAEDDLGPHNKYLGVLEAFPASVLITVDDDIRYAPDLVERLLAAHERWPEAVCALRTNLVRVEGDKLLPYDQWTLEQRELLDEPSHRLLATGNAGVLYPPACLDRHVTDRAAIRATCLMADDLWLKVMELMAGTKVVCLSGPFELDCVEGTQESALWAQNLTGGRNDIQLRAILDLVGQLRPAEELVALMANDNEGEKLS